MQWTAGIPNNEYDEILFTTGGYFTQSSHWAAVQAALGNEVFYARGDGWQWMAVLERGKASSRLYTPYGPHLTKKSGLRQALETLHRLALEKQAMFCRMEPTGIVDPAALREKGLVPAHRLNQPQFTWVKNLAQPEEALLAEMSSTNRNLYRTAANKGLSFTVSRAVGDLPIFLDMMHEVAKLANIIPHSDDEFHAIAATLLPRNAAALYFALHEGKPVASALVYDSPTTRYYAHAASYSEARKLHPGSPLLTHMILDGKANGQTEFDFFGVAPPDEPNHSWAGFTKFKQSFGGEYKEFAGTWELPVKQWAYKKYRLLLKAHKLIKR